LWSAVDALAGLTLTCENRWVNPYFFFVTVGTNPMADHPQNEVTTVLHQIRAGDSGAREQLVGLVYDELRKVAAGLMRQERPDHTLQPTALVHEAFVRLLDQDVLDLAHNRKYFFAAAARAMRQILVDHARQRAALKRQGKRERVPFEETLASFEEQNLDVLALHEALQQLTALHERQGQVVELRFFGGFSVPEVADLLGVSVSLVESDFRKASAFLRSRLAEGT
jgi:RNA polymerase sigma factor (TIGR02999 family)